MLSANNQKRLEKMKPAQGLTKGQGGRLDGTELNAVVEGKTRVRVYPPGRHCPKPMTLSVLLGHAGLKLSLRGFLRISPSWPP